MLDAFYLDLLAFFLFSFFPFPFFVTTLCVFACLGPSSVLRIRIYWHVGLFFVAFFLFFIVMIAWE
ncbi:hypothetical protein V8E55_004974 [Tylopilus felleus]